MSPQGSAEVYVKKPKTDVYAAMLFIAFVALVIGCVCLYMEMDRYNFKFKRTEVTPLPAVSALELPTVDQLV